MTQKLVTESPEKTLQHVDLRKSSPASAKSFQGGLHPIAQLQRTLGNQCVAKLLQAKQVTPGGKIISLQRKLTIGAADDQYEQEADQIARQVMNTSDAVDTASTQRAPLFAGAQIPALQTKPAASITPAVQRQRGKESEVEEGKRREEMGTGPIDTIQGAAGNMAVQRAAHEVGGKGVPIRSDNPLNFQSPTGQLLPQASAVARQPDATEAPNFNPESIVHDLRRAIDQSDVRITGVKTVSTGWGIRQEYVFKRFVSGPKVIEALENLTEAQIRRVDELYRAQEGGRALANDLFGMGESGYPSDLTEEERGRIGALLKGTRAEPQAPGGGPPSTPEGRFEADAIELHGLVDGDLEGAALERVMALHRRPGHEIDRVDSWFARRYGQELGLILGGKLQGLQHSRMFFLRGEDWAKADACAIEDKRRAIEALEAKRPKGIEADLMKMSPGGAETLAGIDTSRQALIAGIDAIIEQNRQEASADPANAGKASAQAVQERIQKILAIQGAKPGMTLGGELVKTLGPTGGGALMAMVGGNLVEAAARQMLDLETRKDINADKIASLLRGLRRQAIRDLQAKASAPDVTQAEREIIAADPVKAVDDLAKGYTEAFVDSYERIRGPARSWRQMVASADEENQPMLVALVRGGGQMLEVEELEFAIRRKNVDAIKAVLRRQPTRTKLDELVQQYELANGGKGSLDRDLFGQFADADIAAYGPKKYTKALVHGRDAAHASESLERPAKLGGDAEVEWIAKHGERELDVTEKTSGLMGSLRELGDDPETQVLMNESAKQLKTLLAEWKANDPWGRPRYQILAEMRRVRAALTGDAAAYEAENEQLVAQLKSAITFAVQVALAFALPGVGAGFLGTMALNIGATVATNMMIQGEDYSLTSFRNDIIGGVLGGFGGKLGEEVVGAVASQVTRSSANATVQAAERAGLSTAALARQAGSASVSAAEQSILVGLFKEGGNLLGGAAGSTVATGENGFTLEGLAQDAFMNIVGKFAPGARARPDAKGSAPPAGEPTTHPAGGEPARPFEGDGARPSGEAPARQAGEPVPPAKDTTGKRPAPAGEAQNPASGESTPLRRPGTASERLEARRIIDSIEQLGSHWPDMMVEERRQALAEITNRVLAARRVPEVRVLVGEVAAGNAAEFHGDQWALIIPPSTLMRGSLPPELVTRISETSRHEADHALQWWAMARLQASKGVRDPAAIAASMDGQLRLEVAQHAIDVTEAYGPLSRAEAATAQVWWNSVFGTNAGVREYNLTQRREFHERLQQLEALVKAQNPPDPALVQQRDQVKLVLEGFDAMYKGLPEEIPAYEQSGIVKAEARLKEAERQLDLAQIALDHANADRVQMEAQIGRALDAGDAPHPNLDANHRRALERVQRLTAQRDAAQREVAAAERIVAGTTGNSEGPGGGGGLPPPGSTPPGSTPGGTTQTATPGSRTVPGTPSVTTQDATPDSRTIPETPSGTTQDATPPSPDTVPQRPGAIRGQLGPAPVAGPGPRLGSGPAAPSRSQAEHAVTEPAPGSPPVRGEGRAPAPPVQGAPPVEQLSAAGWTEKQANVGGINPDKLLLFEHASQQWWLFKPAASEEQMALGPDVGIEAQQRWRRAAAAAALGGRLNFDTPGVRLVEWNGQQGSLQEFRQGLTSGASLQRNSPAEFQRFWDSPQRRDMDAFDFLIANQDRHGGNYMFDGSTNPPRLVLIDQDASFPADARRGYQAQEPRFAEPGGNRERFVRNLPPSISADLAERLIDLHEHFPEATLRQWLTAEEVDGVRSRLGVLITKLNKGQIRMIHPD